MPSRPSARQTHFRVDLQPLDCRTRRRHIEHRLGDEGAHQRRSALLRTTYSAAEVADKSLNPHKCQDRHEEFVVLAYRPELGLRTGEQLLLKRVPVVR